MQWRKNFVLISIGKMNWKLIHSKNFVFISFVKKEFKAPLLWMNQEFHLKIICKKEFKAILLQWMKQEFCLKIILGKKEFKAVSLQWMKQEFRPNINWKIRVQSCFIPLNEARNSNFQSMHRSRWIQKKFSNFFF